MDYLWIVWIIAGVAFAIAEVFTLGFVLLWFAVGAIGASLVALAGLGVGWQVFVFLTVSILLTVASRTILEKTLFQHRGAGLKTGIASLPGKTGTVVEAANGSSEGAVKVFGSTWTAIPVHGEDPLEVGERVTVDRIDGNVIYVRRDRSREGSWRS